MNYNIRRLRPGRLGAPALVLAVIVGFCVLQLRPRAAPPPTPPTPQAVPVVATKVVQQNVPIYATGLGTAQAWRSVVVRAQVTGYLQQIKFTEGQLVKPGDVLAVIDPRPYAAVLAQAEAKKAGDDAQLANDRLNLSRDSALAQKQFASRQQVDNDLALVRQYQANVQADTAAIAAAQLNLEFCTITAPIEGVVGFRQVDIGNLVQANATQSIITIEQVHPIAVVFTLAQQDLPAVQAALAHGKPPVIAYSSDDQTKLAEGTLLTPNNTIDASTGTISLKAIFANAENKLWPGQFVNAHLQLRTQEHALTVPLRAVQHGPDGLFVYLVKPDSTVAHQDVDVSYQDNRIAIISKGLRPDQEVVLSGQSRLQEGTKVSAKPASGNPASQA
jgi:multidrug efflux system membrane fusion protein